MQYCWLERKNNPDCILFMAGWGMDPMPFQDIPTGGYDLLMIYDYNQINDLDVTQFANYENVHLVAWSMGVWVAGTVLAEIKEKFATCTAIGGTLLPIDNGRGIPVQGFEETIAGFSPASLARLYDSMFTGQGQLRRFIDSQPQRSEQSILSELINLRKRVRQLGAGQDIFDYKVVTTRDRIFPPRNQLRAWGRKRSSSMKWPHFPFYESQTWAGLLSFIDNSSA